MRKARIFVHNVVAGILEELRVGQYRFIYQRDYKDSSDWKILISHSFLSQSILLGNHLGLGRVDIYDRFRYDKLNVQTP